MVEKIPAGKRPSGENRWGKDLTGKKPSREKTGGEKTGHGKKCVIIKKIQRVYKCAGDKDKPSTVF